MRNLNFRELMSFSEVARQKSFTKAAATLGVSPPTLSESLRALEDRLGVRLVNRTTRSVALTEAGERLLQELDPLMVGIVSALDRATDYGGTARGRLRLLISRALADLIIGPLVPEFLAAYPEIDLELIVEDKHLDLIADRIDAGIQIGERIEKDMVALRLMNPFDLGLMAAPSYIERHGMPDSLDDLRRHVCVRLRSSWDGAIHPWRLRDGPRDVDTVVDGPVVVNDLRIAAMIVVGGAGIGLLPLGLIGQALQSGALTRVLPTWRSVVDGVYLYHPSRRQPPAALRVFIEFMRSHRRGLTSLLNDQLGGRRQVVM